MGFKIKRTLGARINKISDELNVPKMTVERILRLYLSDLEESVLNGENIVVDNIMSIKQVKESNGEITLRGRVSPALKSKVSKIEILEEIEETED